MRCHRISGAHGAQNFEEEMDVKDFVDMVAAGNTEIDRLEEIACELQAVLAATRPEAITVWTVACDDSCDGTYARVAATEHEAYKILFDIVTPSASEKVRERAKALLDANEYSELFEYIEKECFDDLDTYSIECQTVNGAALPTPTAEVVDEEFGTVDAGVKNDVATVLAALRLFQRTYDNMGSEQIIDEWPDHFGQWRTPLAPLGSEDIDDLCERINGARDEALRAVFGEQKKGAAQPAATTTQTQPAKPDQLKVVVEVEGGIAEVTSCPDSVEVEIIDHDASEDDEGD